MISKLPVYDDAEDGREQHHAEACHHGVQGGVVGVGVQLPLELSLGEQELAVLLRLAGHHVGQHHHQHRHQVEPLSLLTLLQEGLDTVSDVLRRQ